MNTKSIKLSSYPFRGYDFMELAEAWNVYIGDEFWIAGVGRYHVLYSDADVIAVYLKEVCKKYDGCEPTRAMRKHAKDIRIFTKALSQGMTYDAPLWYGMSKIEDDWTLLQYAIQLMSCMWT